VRTCSMAWVSTYARRASIPGRAPTPRPRPAHPGRGEGRAWRCGGWRRAEVAWQGRRPERSVSEVVVRCTWLWLGQRPSAGGRTQAVRADFFYLEMKEGILGWCCVATNGESGCPAAGFLALAKLNWPFCWSGPARLSNFIGLI
jgi:hypothetical protein